MTAKKLSTKSTWVDPDDAPELTAEWFEKADLYKGEKLVRRGRPTSESPKISTTVRFSPEVIEHFRAGGRGWQTRMDEALKTFIAEHPNRS